MEGEILLPCIISTIHLWKGEHGVMYRWGYRDLNHKEVGLTTVYAIGRSMELEQDKRPVTACPLIHEQYKDSNCPQVSSTIWLRDWGFISTGMGFWSEGRRLMGQCSSFSYISTTTYLIWPARSTICRKPVSKTYIGLGSKGAFLGTHDSSHVHIFEKLS